MQQKVQVVHCNLIKIVVITMLMVAFTSDNVVRTA